MTTLAEITVRDPSSAAPAWFKGAIANTPRRGTVRVDDTDIEVLEWGERGQPGVLLIHGYTAHADWWSFTAPLLASGRHVVALSLSGMGQSGWRAAYSMTQHARETMAVAEHVGLFDVDGSEVGRSAAAVGGDDDPPADDGILPQFGHEVSVARGAIAGGHPGPHACDEGGTV